MKNLRYIIMGCLLIAGSTSCKKWLDVNLDPTNPNNENVAIQNRIPWIEHYYQYSSGVTNFRSAALAGVYYSTSAAGNALSTTWTSHTGNTTPYQTYFVEVASNLNDLYNNAQKSGAYHYMAVADVFHALGFMQMLDVYGEMPYTQAISGIANPAFDDGKTIYNGCMAKLNEAIYLFGQTQAPAAPALSLGDLWSPAGDVNKWIRFCWGLKARYMIKLSKKTDLYNADSILNCLSKGPQSNADNITGPGFNNSTVTDYLIAGDPVVTNGNFNYAAFGSTQRISKYYYDLLVNMRGSGVVDPRMTKIMPASMSDIVLTAGRVTSYTWLRSRGVDIYGRAPSRLTRGGAASIVVSSFATANTTVNYKITNAADFASFVADQTAAGRPFTTNIDTVKVTYRAGSIYINSPNYLYAGDTAYVNLRSSSIATSGIAAQGQNDVSWYPSLQAFTAGAVGSTGSFQTRPISDQEILTFHEMNFIKAEMFFRKGDVASAYTAYKDAIQAHLNMMQAKLTSWNNVYTQTNPDMAPMNAAAMTAYMTSAAVAQSAGAMTMSDIMLQKYLAMGCSIENWNDMRRCNFSAGNVGGYGVIYPGFDRGPLFAGTAQYTGSAKTDPRYWMRRFSLPTTLELNYNLTNVLAINKHGADPNIWSMPVWWDCATDAEYNAYLTQ